MNDPRLKLFDMGYTDLVSVAPPGVETSPNSGLRADDLGKRPAKKGSQGWYGYAWITDTPTREDVRRWVQWDANVGLRGTSFPALDIDVGNPELVAVIRRLAIETLGPAPARQGSAPKELLVYRTEQPFSRVAVEIPWRNGPASGKHLVEFLGHGRQYLVYGTHPSGSEYRWLRSPLWDLDPERLSVITPEQVETFLSALERKLGGLGYEVSRVGRASAVDKDAPPQEDLVAPSIEALSALVRTIPNDDRFSDRDDYIMLGHAIKAAAGEDEEEGYLIFQSWADRWEGGTNDPETVRSDWRRMHPPFRVGYSWLVEQADSFEAAVWEFEADPNAKPAPVTVERDPTLPLPVDLTDDWLAEKIMSEVASKLRFDYPNARWHVWDGQRWAGDSSGRAERVVIYALRALATVLRGRIEQLAEGERKPYYATIAKLGNVVTTRNVLTMLQSHPAIAVGADAFDNEAMQLNTPAGIVDLETGAVLPHDSRFMHSKITEVGPGSGSAPRWERFIDEVTRGDQALANFMQKQAGYALTGVIKEQTLSFVWGPGGNGKSVFVDTLMGIMKDYGATAPMDTFASTKGDKHPTDLAGLMGARLVTSSETQVGRSWDEQRIKAVTGGDRLRARFMRQDFVEFQPRFKLILIGNHEPQIEVVDDAMRRRIHIVPFTFKPETPDLNLTEKLQAEYPAILRWMIDGCLMWQTEGLEAPECVLARTRQYFEDEDLLGQWLEECCKVTRKTQDTMARSDAYRSWQRFCGERGEFPGTLKGFRRLVAPYEAKLGFLNGKVGDRERRAAGWSGIRLLDENDEIRGRLV